MPKSAISVRRISLRHVSLGRRAALALAALLAAASALGASAQAQPGSAPHEIAFVDQTRAEVPVQAQIKLLCSDDEGRLFEKKALVVAGLGSGFVTPIAFPQCRGATLILRQLVAPSAACAVCAPALRWSIGCSQRRSHSRPKARWLRATGRRPHG
mgnify:CR=1 FL=1